MSYPDRYAIDEGYPLATDGHPWDIFFNDRLFQTIYFASDRDRHYVKWWAMEVLGLPASVQVFKR